MKKELREVKTKLNSINNIRYERKWSDGYLVKILCELEHSGSCVTIARKGLENIGYSLEGIGVGYSYNGKFVTMFTKEVK